MKNILTHLKLLTVAAIWGVGWPAGRVLANDIEPFAASWIRYVIAVLCFLLFLRLTNQWIIPTKGEWKRIALIGFFSTCVYQAFFMFGMQYTAAGDASLMITFNPFFTAILAIFFLDEKIWSSEPTLSSSATEEAESGPLAVPAHLAAPPRACSRVRTTILLRRNELFGLHLHPRSIIDVT